MKFKKYIIKNSDILLGVILILLKIFFIEMDPPSWLVAYYQPIDEMYYVQLAYDYIDYQQLFYSDRISFFGTPLLSNIVAFFTLGVFGDNYYGLRLGSVFFGVMSMIIFVLLTRKFIFFKLIRFLAILFFGLNFSFTMATMYVEPTISRTFSLLVVIYIIVNFYDSILKNPKRIILINSIVFTILLITYPTNLFTLLASYALLVIYPMLINNKERTIKLFFIRNTYYLLSILIPVVLIWITFLSFEINIVENILNRGGDYSSRVAFSVTNIYRNFINIGRSNLFIYNPLLCIVFFLSISLFVSKKIKKEYLANEVVIIFCFLTCFILQSFFINDFPQRKLIIMLPMILLLISWYVNDIYEKELLFNKKIIFNCIISFIILAVLFVLLNNLKRSIGTVSLFLGLMLFGIIVYNRKIDKIKLFAVFLLLISSELFFSIKNYVLEPTFNYKLAQEKLSKYNGEKFIGGYSIGFRAYNNIKPVLNPYLYYGNKDAYDKKIIELTRENDFFYTIGDDDEIENNKGRGFVVLDTLLKYNETVNYKNKSVYLYIKEQKDSIGIISNLIK